MSRSKAGVGSRYRHARTNKTYTVVCHAVMEKDTKLVVVYRSDSDSDTWVRDYEEFYDGRFILIQEQGNNEKL